MPLPRKAPRDESERLSRISTIWTTVEAAHQSQNSLNIQSRGELVKRYRGAAYRYLLGALRDQDAAEEVFQEFAVKMLSGRFRGATETKGRFRDYLRTSLIRMVSDYKRGQRNAGPRVADLGLVEPSAAAPEPTELFQTSWREELLALVWSALEVMEQTQSQPYHTVLRLRVQQPELRSEQLADLVSQQVGGDAAYTAASVRKLLQRARETFGRLLVYEVAQSIESSDRNEIESELIDLDLHAYCAAWLAKSEIS